MKLLLTFISLFCIIPILEANTVRAKSGKVYENPTIESINEIYVEIMHSSGVARVPIRALPDEYREKHNLPCDDEVRKNIQHKRDQEEQRRKARQERIRELNQPLEGEDLDAWRLARDAARRRVESKLNRTRTSTIVRPVPGGFSRIPTSRSYNYELIERDPINRYMRKTDTGDWLFAFIAEDSSRESKRRIILEVLNFPREIRIGEIDFERIN